jgi:type I restriction enzyme M protein
MPEQIGFLKEGWDYDRATSRPVDIRKPEEAVRQKYEQILHDDYGYDYVQMDIEVFIKRGSRSEKGTKEEKAGKDRADIVIYSSTDKGKRDQHQDIIGIVETKRPEKTDGIKQLMSYMSASSARWGVWTNGELGGIEYIYKDAAKGTIKRDFIFDIPKCGESVEEMGNLTKARLIPATDLKLIFTRLLKTLYANTNISRREKLGSEMIRFIFAKIWDERYDWDKPPKFRVSLNDTPEQVKTRIQALFKEVKDELVMDGVFEKNEEITLDPKSAAWVVGQLQRYSLHDTDKDAVGDAFEVFAESKFVGEKGEFFTPIEIIRTAIALVDPQPHQSILDPACGSGRFLIYALEHVWDIMEHSKKYKGSPDSAKLKQEAAERYFYGIDKEIDLVKIAKAYMAIVGDGRGGIVQQNTLHTAEEFEGRAREMFVEDGDKPHLKQFNTILTNPPFGANIKVLKNDAANFKLGHVWKKDANGEWQPTTKAKDTEPQILFVERCLDMLKNEGTLAIVLPETIFHAPNSRYVLNHIKSGNNIKAIVDLAHNTFRPHNNAKTLLVVLQKGVPQQDNIIMAVTEETGHDHQGRTLYRFDVTSHHFTGDVWDDTKIVRKELQDLHNPDNQYVFTVKAKDIVKDIYVPRYYWQKRTQSILADATKTGYEPVRMQKLLDEGIIAAYAGHGSPPSGFKGRGEVPYIRVADIVNWELYKNQTALIPREIYLKIKGKRGVDLQSEDIIFVRRGSYRIGTVAMVSPFDIEVLLTGELVILRILKPDNEYGLDPYYLLYLLSHDLTQRQLPQKIMIDTTLPNIADRWKELYLPFNKDKEQAAQIAKRIKTALQGKWKAQEEIGKLRSEFGGIVT